ncbi:hypothetical protein BDF22DRAFT_223221 [Syncephalis plumigaleata]|nr:hypothetical protein BDF22DRAFT_223221 [Syncephalis plumigaleata]
MDNQTVPFGTPAPVNRRRSNIIASRLQGEKSTPARGSNSSFRKQLFQEAAVAAAASSSSNRTTTDERIANTTVVDFELGTPIPCKQMADTSMRMDMTPASISKSLGERPNFLTPRLVKPDEKAFNSTGLMSKRKKAITDSASSMALSDDMTRSTASNSASRMHVGGVPDTPCKRSPTDFVPGKGLSNTLFMAQQTPRPAAPFVRSSLKHPLSLSGDQERSRKRLHIDNHDDNDNDNNNHNATDVNSPMVYSPEFPKSNKSIGSNSGNTTPPTARTLISIPSSPIRENSFLRDAPSPTPSGSESPLSIATRPYPYRATMMTRDRSSGQQASHSSTMMTIPDTPPLQHADGIGDVDDPPSSPCVWHDANEEILLSQEDPIIHAPPANSLLHRLVTARHNKETNNERFAMEKKLNKLIVNDYTTLFAHFLRSSYFEQLDQEQGQRKY